MEPDPPTDPVDTHDDDGTPPRRESKRLRDRAPVVVSLPAHPRDSTPDRRPPPLHFSTKHYPASAHGERRAGHTHFPRLPPDHAPGPLPDGASASFSYRGPPQPPIPGAAPPVPPPPGGTPLVLDRERPPPPPDYEYGTSQQAMLANMLSQRIDQVDQLRTQLAHAEARIASLSARSNPSAALAQAEARAEAAESRLAAIKEAWRGVESYLDMLGRREAEARAAFIRTLNTGEIGVPPSVPVFGAPTSPYLPVRPPVPPNVPARATTFPALPPAPVVGGNPVIWRHESGRRRPAGDDDEPPSKRQRPDRRREREVRKEKARFSDSPSPPPKDKDTDLSPPIAAIADDKDADADADGDEEVDQIVDDVEMTPAKPDSRPRRSSDPAVPTRDARAGSAGARSDGAVRDLKDKDKDAKEKDPKDKDVKDKDGKEKDPKTNGAEDDAMDAEGSPETDTDELSVDEELLKLSSKSRRKPREREREREYEYDREYARTDFSRPSGYAHDYARYGDPRYGPQGGWYGEYWPEDYRDNGLSARGYQPPPVAPPRAEFAQRNGSGSGTSAPWYAHLKPNSAVQTNTQGQRTCRQCGLAGRYKDGKCVEKWGPGPEGPGTVCDRCRKKMKRVERRGTADASVLASGLGGMPLHHQQQGSFHSVTQPSTQTQTQTPSTQPQTQSTQMSQTQLGTQYSPQRNWNANGNGRYENGRYDGPGAGAGAGGEKRYDLLPSHYAAASSSPAEDERRKGRRREREASPEGAPAAPVKGETAVEAQ